MISARSMSVRPSSSAGLLSLPKPSGTSLASSRQERTADPLSDGHGIVAVGCHQAPPARRDRGDGEGRGANDIDDQDSVSIDILGNTAWNAIDDHAGFDATVDPAHAGAVGRRLSCVNASKCSPRR